MVIDLDHADHADLPQEMAICAITLAELTAGPHSTNDPSQRAARQDRLQRVEATFDALLFDANAARAYGRVYAAVLARGRKARGARALDLQIAAVALSNELPLYTRNPSDFQGLEDLIRVVPVP